MSLQSAKAKAERFCWRPGREDDIYERLRHAAASKLLTWHEHSAGKGSLYITIGETLKLRFADHENTSSQHDEPDFNFVNRYPAEEDFEEIVNRIQYPRICKKTTFAMHVGLTAPKLKKLLPPDQHTECYEDVCENDYYYNTATQYVVVNAALAALRDQGIMDRIPVRQESLSEEDYSGA